MIYLDTSVLVAAFALEAETERAQAWLWEQPPGTLAISAWTRVEFAAALRFKSATSQITEAQRAVSARQFSKVLEAALTTWSVEVADMEMATLIAATDELRLRAPDSLHLAMARRRSATLCTLDQGLARACDLVGHPTVRP